MNVRDVGEEGDGRQIVHRAGEEILLTAVLLHQGEGLIRVKEDLIGRHEEDARNHALKTDRWDVIEARMIEMSSSFVELTYFTVSDEATEQLEAREIRWPRPLSTLGRQSQ